MPKLCYLLKNWNLTVHWFIPQIQYDSRNVPRLFFRFADSSANSISHQQVEVLKCSIHRLFTSYYRPPMIMNYWIGFPNNSKSFTEVLFIYKINIIRREMKEAFITNFNKFKWHLKIETVQVCKGIIYM